MEDSVFNNLVGKGRSGIQGSSTATLTRVSVDGNSATTGGGSFFVVDSTLTLTDITVGVSTSLSSEEPLQTTVRYRSLMSATSTIATDHGGFLYAIDASLGIIDAKVTALSHHRGASIYKTPLLRCPAVILVRLWSAIPGKMGATYTRCAAGHRLLRSRTVCSQMVSSLTMVGLFLRMVCIYDDRWVY